MWKSDSGRRRDSQEDVLTVEKRWGYFSRKTGEIIFDLCEDCYDDLVRIFTDSGIWSRGIRMLDVCLLGTVAG